MATCNECVSQTYWGGALRCALTADRSAVDGRTEAMTQCWDERHNDAENGCGPEGVNFVAGRNDVTWLQRILDRV